MRLLDKFHLALYKLDYHYVQNVCQNVNEIENILTVLKSGEEGFYPDLENVTEIKLRLLNPNSLMLPENCGVGLIKKNCASELGDWAKNLPISQKNSDFELPPIRGQNTDLVFDQKIAKSRQSNVGTSNYYEKWDKYDPDVELLKIDLKRERNLNNSLNY